MAHAIRDRLEKRIILSHLALIVVAIGSFSFHGTLRYGAQLLDELPMIYGSCVFVFTILDESLVARHNGKIITFLILYSAIVTVWYLYFGNAT